MIILISVICPGDKAVPLNRKAKQVVGIRHQVSVFVLYFHGHEWKIRAIGVSNFNLEQLKEGNANGYIDVVQDEYNLLNQSAEENLFPYCREQGISFIPYFPFASGLLAGKYTETSVLSEKQQQRPQFQGDTYLDILKRVDLIRPLAVKHHTGLQNIVLAYYLTKDVVDAVIPGARNRQQVLENLEAAEVRLDAADIALIQQAFPASYRLPK